MNERIRELYDQSIVLEGNGDYVAGELDPVKFAELIVRECANVCGKDTLDYRYIKEHFGVK
jgi:hypothetical protein